MARALTLLVILIALDICSKSLMFAYIEQPVSLLSFLSLTLAKNTGVSFGLAKDWVATIIGVNLLLLFFVMAIAYKESDKITRYLWVCVLAGGLANLYDRVVLGYVRDFLHLHIGPYSWPIFNLADCYISLAVLGLLLRYHYTSSKV